MEIVLLLQGEFFYMKGVKFVNYGATAALTTCSDCLGGEMMAQGGFTYRVEDLTFVNSSKRLTWAPNYKEIFIDKDGSFAGKSGSYVIKAFDFNKWPECRALPFSVYEDSLRCDDTTVRRLSIENITPNQLQWTGTS